MKGENLSSKDNFMVKTITFLGLAIITLYLLTEHRAHLLEYSSFIVFFAFILIHLFMHSGNGEHGGSGGHGGCCGGGHDHTGKHKHKEVEQEEPQNTGGHEDVHKHEYNQEKFT